MTALATAQGADQLGNAGALTDGYSAAFLGAAGIAVAGAPGGGSHAAPPKAPTAAPAPAASPSASSSRPDSHRGDTAGPASSRGPSTATGACLPSRCW